MTKTDGYLNNDIIRITEEVMSDGTLDDIIRARVTKGFESAIDSAFSWGELNTAIKKRVNEVMIPYIENYDMSAYIVKLDSVLTDIVNATALTENRTLLENFKGLMVESDEKTISLEELFEDFCRYVAKNVDTSNLEIDYVDEPSYCSVTAIAEIERGAGYTYSDDRHATLSLRVEDDDALGFTVHLRRRSHERGEGYAIVPDSVPNLSTLRYLSDFEVMLLSLARSGIRVTWTDDRLSEDVEPEEKPEASWW